MKTTTEITYLGTLLICTGEYTTAEQGVMWDVDLAGSPDEPATFEIDKIETEGGDNITGIFYDCQLEDIQELCKNNLE